jgi:hypothetical protein
MNNTIGTPTSENHLCLAQLIADLCCLQRRPRSWSAQPVVRIVIAKADEDDLPAHCQAKLHEIIIDGEISASTTIEDNVSGHCGASSETNRYKLATLIHRDVIVRIHTSSEAPGPGLRRRPSGRRGLPHLSPAQGGGSDGEPVPMLSQILSSPVAKAVPPSMRTNAAMLSVAAVLVLAPCSAMGATCPPDGNEGSLPTFDVEDQCGDPYKCTALALEEAKACSRKFDECAVALSKSNAEAEAHNLALEACRAGIPNRQKASSPKPSSDGAAPTAPPCNRLEWT